MFFQDEVIGMLSSSSIGTINSSPAKDLVMAQFYVSTEYSYDAKKSSVCTAGKCFFFFFFLKYCISSATSVLHTLVLQLEEKQELW